MRRAVPKPKPINFIVDDEDKYLLTKYGWQITKTGYALTNNKVPETGKKEYLHRLIMKCPKGMYVDHINHDTLDNRRSNLRICTNAENAWNTKKRSDNTTGCKGVTRHNAGKGYVASITHNKKSIYLGFTKDLETAINMRKEAEKIYHKDFVLSEEVRN